VGADRTYLVQASVSPETSRLAATETYAEFTQLQKLLQQYQRSLGAVGKAATVFTEQVWFRKNASGRQYLPHQLLADLGKDELAATEVSSSDNLTLHHRQHIELHCGRVQCAMTCLSSKSGCGD
jgi:hypothetical protein